MSATDPVILLLGNIPEEVEKTKILSAGEGLTVRELNAFIVDIRRQAADFRRLASDRYAIADILSDEVRRRAEELDNHNSGLSFRCARVQE